MPPPQINTKTLPLDWAQFCSAFASSPFIFLRSPSLKSVPMLWRRNPLLLLKNSAYCCWQSLTPGFFSESHRQVVAQFFLWQKLGSVNLHLQGSDLGPMKKGWKGLKMEQKRRKTMPNNNYEKDYCWRKANLPPTASALTQKRGGRQRLTGDGGSRFQQYFKYFLDSFCGVFHSCVFWLLPLGLRDANWGDLMWQISPNSHIN